MLKAGERYLSEDLFWICGCEMSAPWHAPWAAPSHARATLEAILAKSVIHLALAGV